MSKINHQRGHAPKQDNGPGYESHTPAAGCNSTHVARSRAKWKRRHARQERRTGKDLSMFGSGRVLPPVVDDE